MARLQLNQARSRLTFQLIPNNTYAKDGWAGCGDWLGTDTIAHYLREYRSFKKARAFVRRLGLKSLTEWRDYCKSGKKPDRHPG